MNPILSVIVPVYNTQIYLKECIESIVNQTFCNYEVILVDDGSTDNSGSICDFYAEKYEFIKVIHKPNTGIANTRKIGFLNSCGKYISFIDSDDTIENHTYKYMTEKAQKHDADAVICDLLIDMPDRTIIRKNIVKSGFYNKELLKKEFYPYMLFGGENGTPGIIPSLCNKIIKRDVLEKVLLATDDRVVFGEDTLCTFPCLLDANRIYVSNRAFYHYRMVETSVTHVYDSTLVSKFILLIKLLKKEFEKRNFDDKQQLNLYTVRFSIDIIRNELLYNKKLSLKERLKSVSEYLNHPQISKAFNEVTLDKFRKNNYIKVKLIKRRNILALFMFFYIKNTIFRFWRGSFG